LSWTITHEKFLSEDDVRQLRKHIEAKMLYAKAKGSQIAVRDYTIIEFTLGTGLRVSEIAKVKLNDLGLGKGQNSVIVRRGKGGKTRQVTFSSRLKQIIKDYLEYRTSKSEYLFPSQRQSHLSTSALWRVFKNAAKDAGLSTHFRFHDLRHTYCTRLYKSSHYNLRLVQQQAGHSSPNTTTVYAHVLDQDIEQAVESME